MSLIDWPVPPVVVGARVVRFAGGSQGDGGHQGVEERRSDARERGRKWREAHPEYRARKSELQRLRRRHAVDR